ncbi:MAG: dipeptidase, partial [Chitinivibrionia bacterium]|nr:dipeptidase [Chitinivibrionia bacterium]
MTPRQYLQKNEKRALKELFELLQFPSVSAKSENRKDVAKCAKWLVQHLKGIGFKTRLMPTGGHPVVYAEYLVDKNLPTALYYGHYDVQPPEPLKLWTTPPFKPTVRGGYIFARGAADDKGQVFAHLMGLQALLETTGTLPINVKLLIEGEEEVHSAHLPTFLKQHKEMLSADLCVVSDSGQYDRTTPAVTYGLRGIASVEVFVYGPNRNLHSGTFGGTVGNPVTVLCEMIGRLHDRDGKVAIPGFYGKVKPIGKFEREQTKKLRFNENLLRKGIGVGTLQGEKGFSALERTWMRPTCEINGITGGYQGEGAKTIIPSLASAKITMRLVPNQDPMDACNRIEKYLKQIAPESVTVKVDKHGGAKAVRV